MLAQASIFGRRLFVQLSRSDLARKPALGLGAVRSLGTKDVIQGELCGGSVLSVVRIRCEHAAPHKFLDYFVQFHWFHKVILQRVK